MALVSPGVEVTVIDQSQYLPAPSNSIPLVVVATAQNKADASGTAVAAATTAANAGKLFQVTSQRDLVNLYGTPFFYSSGTGTPIQGYELNEYGLLAAYSALGSTNRVYVLRADIDLASLVGQTSRPSGTPDNGAYWLNTSKTTWGIYEFNKVTGKFTNMAPKVLTNSTDLSGGVPLASLGSVGDYAVYATQLTSSPDLSKEYFYKTTNNVWVPLGSLDWKLDIPTVQGSVSNPVLTATNTFTISMGSAYNTTITVPASTNNTVEGISSAINALGWAGLTSSVRSGKLCIFHTDASTDFIVLAEGTGTPLATMGITAGKYYQPKMQWGTAAQMPLWTTSQAQPRPSGSVWLKVGSAGTGYVPALSKYNQSLKSWVAQSVSLATSDWAATAVLDQTGGGAIPAGTIYAQYNYDGEYNQGPVYLYSRTATGATVVTSSQTNFVTGIGGPYTMYVQVSTPGSSNLSGVYTLSVPSSGTPTDFVTAWSAAGIPNTTAVVTTAGAVQLTHTTGGEIILNDYIDGISNGLLTTIGFVPGLTTGVKWGPGIQVSKSITVTQTIATGNIIVCDSTGQLTVGGIIGFNAALGGIYATVNYTVGSIIDSKRFTIIDPVTTVTAVLSDATGSIKASVVIQNATTGAGTGATFDAYSSYGQYYLRGDGVARGGTGYVIGEQLTIAGTVFGGNTPTNDLVVEVTANTAATFSGIVGTLGSATVGRTVFTASTSVTTNAVFTASIAGTTMTVTNVSSGTLAAGQTLVGAGVLAGTYITVAAAGGSVGSYTINTAASQTVGSVTMTAVTTTLTVSEVEGGSVVPLDVITAPTLGTALVVGQTINPEVTALGTGTGKTGTYTLSGYSSVVSNKRILGIDPYTTANNVIMDVDTVTASTILAGAAFNATASTLQNGGTVSQQNTARNTPAITTTAIGTSGASSLTLSSTSGLKTGVTYLITGTGVPDASSVTPMTATWSGTGNVITLVGGTLGAAAVGGTYAYSLREIGYIGVYTLSAAPTAPAVGAVTTSSSLAIDGTTLTVTAVQSGAIALGQTITATAGLTSGTILADASTVLPVPYTGSGGVGTYQISGAAQFAPLVAGASAPLTMFADAGAAGVVTFVSGTPSSPTQYKAQLSNWQTITYTSAAVSPVNDPANGTNWFFSVVDQVDIMVQKNGSWIGYRNTAYDSSGAPSSTGTNSTDPAGPIVSASKPTKQSDGTPLQYGDLWIDTSDLENYPMINRWQNSTGEDSWIRIDNTDQTSSSGIMFGDARWGTSGSVDPINDTVPTITSLLVSNYLDLDAPSPSLYPQGTLLFNTRRSGYVVKRWDSNRWNNVSYPGITLPTIPGAWVTVSGNKTNGSPYMGRKAQRAVVVAALRSAVDTSAAARDEDNAFNLICAPNYPELQPNMVVLNADRGYTGYILGDTPLRLKDDATQIQAWATNAALASSTGEDGCVTRDTYLGLFYPSGIANDLSGNEVVVPASHMMLRTFLRNDNIAYPWLAAAGTRRGIIDNALNIGYIDAATGEFVAIKTRIGIRDVLYVNFINPLVFFTGVGLLNYGNKTSYNSQSALDRTNVARLIAYVRRQLAIATRPFIFEPNDQLTRQQVTGVVESLFIDLVAKRGVYDYLVVCDESNNTPARIDRNELWVDIAIEPVKAVEFIYIPIRILNTGELSGA